MAENGEMVGVEAIAVDLRGREKVVGEESAEGVPKGWDGNSGTFRDGSEETVSGRGRGREVGGREAGADGEGEVGIVDVEEALHGGEFVREGRRN